MERSVTNPKWLRKILIFGLVALGFGCWALYDVLITNPRRGAGDVEYKLLVYLQSASAASRLTDSDTTVADPKAEFAQLSAEIESHRKGALGTGPEARQAKFLAARHDWLEAHKHAWTLKPENTAITGVAEKLKDLDTRWKSLEAPKPLGKWDIPLEYVWLIAGFGLAGYMALLIVQVSRKSYTYDRQKKALTIPGGRVITLLDCADFDRRRWHKLFISIVLTDGTSMEFDLYRFKWLEEFIVDMEYSKFPDRKPAEPEPAAPEASVG
jgi:hypothetical protein